MVRDVVPNLGITDSEWCLPYKDGKCVYLGDDDKCTIYESRPERCREFNCVNGYKCKGEYHSYFLEDHPEGRGFKSHPRSQFMRLRISKQWSAGLAHTQVSRVQLPTRSSFMKTPLPPCEHCSAYCCKQRGHDFAVLLEEHEVERFDRLVWFEM